MKRVGRRQDFDRDMALQLRVRRSILPHSSFPIGAVMS
jgi:hypothetical protein